MLFFPRVNSQQSSNMGYLFHPLQPSTRFLPKRSSTAPAAEKGIVAALMSVAWLILVGGWTLPIRKIWVRQLGWWHSQYMEKQNMFQTTNQYYIQNYPNVMIISHHPVLFCLHFCCLWADFLLLRTGILWADVTWSYHIDKSEGCDGSFRWTVQC